MERLHARRAIAVRKYPLRGEQEVGDWAIAKVLQVSMILHRPRLGTYWMSKQKWRPAHARGHAMQVRSVS